MFSTISGNAQIAYHLSGEGIPLVLLHCTGASSAAWDKVSADIGPGFRKLAVDLHGFGDSDPWPGERPLSLADEAEAVLAAAKVIERPFHLVGHSYGGAVALKLALTAPERIASLTVIEPVSFHLLRDRGEADRRRLKEVSRIAHFVAGLDPDIPYALLGFHPHFFIPDLPRTSVRHAEEAEAAAKAAGLTRVRVGNRHLLSRDY